MFAKPLVPVMVLLATVGCRANFQFGMPSIVGSGVTATQIRPVGKFEQVDVGGAAHLIISVEDSTSAEIEFDDNLMDIVSLEVHGDRLIIRTHDSYKSEHGLKVKLTTPKLTGLHLSGASNAQVTGVDSDKFALSLSGASNATIEGTATNIRIDASGASQVHCSDLHSDSVTASLSGASSAEVHAAHSISASASGASRVRYHGSPENVQRSISGASTVQRTD